MAVGLPGRRLVRALVLGMLLSTQCWVAAKAADPVPAGRVEFAIGSPTAAGRDNRARPLARGASVFEGDLINTGAGRVQVRFTDGGFVSLQPQTQFKVEQYRYAGKQDGNEKGIFNLVKGGMRTITGLIGKNDNKNYRVHTKVATIGVRGTEYSLNMDTTLHGSVAQGQIDVCSAGGCAPFARGESFIVPNGAARPVMTLRKASLPAPQPGERHQSENHRGEQAPGEAGKTGERTAAAQGLDGPATGEVAPPPNAPPPPEGGAPLVNADGTPQANMLPPPPPPGADQGFVQGNATDGTGASIALKLTGSHFLAYMAAHYQGTGTGTLVGPTMGNALLDSNGNALVIGPYTLTSVKGGSNGFSAGGEALVTPGSQAFHYAIGYPTLPSEIQQLQVNAPVLAYTHLAGTVPTGFFGNTPPTKEDPIGKYLGGTMSVNLATSAATVQMNLELAGTAMTVTGANLPVTLGNGSTPATRFTGGCSAGANCQMRGFLVGPQAVGAMLVYEFGNANITTGTGPTTVTARGMAVFQKAP